MSIWLCAFGDHSAALTTRISAALAAGDVRAHTLDPDRVDGPGIVVFDEISNELCAAITELSCRGLERVVAIGTAPAPVRSGDWRLLSAGAADVLYWGGLADPVAAVTARFQRWAAVDAIVASPLVRDNLVGSSAAWIGVLRRIVEVARFSDSAVLIMGESGTGKELIARLVHTLDARTDKKELVVVDCTTIVPELAGSELFGHERGAFTGAITARDGAIAQANRGTLFLDEIGELPLVLQAELLRAVQEGTYKRVGGNAWQRSQFRVVSATNRDLIAEQASGKFRSDLYYRIANWTCVLPPLRDRPADVLPLVRHFAQQLGCSQGTAELDDPVREYFLGRACPGNVRDLKQVVAQMVRRHVGPGPFTVGDIPEDQRPAAAAEPVSWVSAEFEQGVRRAVAVGAGLKDIGRAAEDLAVRAALEAEEHNVRRAAVRLQVTDRAVQLRQAQRRRRWATRNGGPQLGPRA